MAELYDLIVRGGLLVDPSQGIHAKRDIAIHQGRVVRVEENLDAVPRKDAGQIIDASGRIVTPGLIDIHFHARPESLGHLPLNPSAVWSIGLDPDRCLGTGVTTAVDAGTYGVENFSLAFLQMAKTSRTRLFAFINPLPFGLAGRADQRHLDDAVVARLVDTYERNKDHIVGVKVLLTRHHWQNLATILDYLDVARKVADITGLPMMVHGIQKDQGKWRGITPQDVLSRLTGHDIITHCFCQYKSFMNWEAIEEIRKAVGKGLVLDVGHGTGSFSFDVAEKAIELGLPPTTISSDLHQMNYVGPVYDLATTMSKFLLLGLSLDEVVEKTTVAPARAIGMAGKLGTLKVGAVADAVILDLAEEEFTFEDSFGNRRIGNERLIPRAVVREGIVYLGGTWGDVGWVPGGPLFPPDQLASKPG